MTVAVVGGGGSVRGGGDSRPEDPSPTLDQGACNLTCPPAVVHVVPKRCRRCGCEACGCRARGSFRRYLRSVMGDDASWQMLTLTVDLKGTITGRGFDSPGAAWRAVMVCSLICRLMKRLGIRDWIWVLEWQRNGNPHWHVAYRSRWVDFTLAWRLWRDVWGIGGLKFPEKRVGVGSLPAYLAKYLGKGGSVPAWVKELPASTVVRMHQGSRSLPGFENFRRAERGLVARSVKGRVEVAGSSPRVSDGRTLGMVFASCGSRSVAFEVSGDLTSECRRFRCELRVSLRTVRVCLDRMGAGYLVLPEFEVGLRGTWDGTGVVRDWCVDESGRWYPGSKRICGVRGIAVDPAVFRECCERYGLYQSCVVGSAREVRVA